MSQQLELSPIEYHLAYYPLVVEEEGDWTQFQKFSDEYKTSPGYPDYTTFTTNVSRLQIVRDLRRMFQREFYYVLAFQRGDGGFFIESRPKDCLRAQNRVPADERADMMKCFEEVAGAVEAKANIKYLADKKRYERQY